MVTGSISRLLGKRNVCPPVDPPREWKKDDIRAVISGHEVRIYIRDRVQIFDSSDPGSIACRFDAGRFSVSDDAGNKVCYENALPYDGNGEPYRWGMVVGIGSTLERAECFIGKDEAKSAAEEIWNMLSESERKVRYCLVGRIDPDFMITKALDPIWWPDVL